MKIHRKKTHFAAAAFLLSGCLLFVIFALSAIAGTTPDWYFSSAGDFTAWRGEGIEAGGPRPGRLQVRGGEEFRLFSPPGLGIPAAEKPYLRIRFRPQSPRYLRAIWIDGTGRPVLVPEAVQPPLDRNFHTFWIPLAKGAEHRGTIETLGLVVGGHPGWVEIESVEIRPFSFGQYLRDQWRNFLLPRGLNLASINSLSSPQIFGKPFVSWLNILAILACLLAMVFYFRARDQGRNRIVLRASIVLLTIWVAYDVRESYSQFQTMKEIHDSYVKPPPGEKTFPSLGDFYCFVDLCREAIPETAQYHFYSLPMWPFDCRIQYFLYPRGIKSSTWNRYVPGGETPYHAVYQDPGIQYDHATGRLIRRGEGGDSFISRPGKIVSRFNTESFIFRENEVNR